jgi:diguanylate cyclase (GGDEF)-like protein
VTQPRTPPEAQAAADRAPAVETEPRPEARETTPGERDAGSWDPELVDALYGLVHRQRCTAVQLDQELARLRNERGETVYSALIFLLCNLRFSPSEAREHWTKIVEHRTRLEKQTKSAVDPRVALVSYFLQVNRQLDNPIVIELKLLEKTRDSAYRDGLTGLHNYRFFTETLPEEIRRADRYNLPLSLLMIDVDDFKLYNDAQGHAAANEVLTSIAGLIRASVRRIDVTARYGGEEFAVILPSTPKTGARLVAERIRETIERTVFHGEQKLPRGTLTVSVGVATWPADARDLGDFLRRADRAMYEAKSNGKNQVALWGHSSRSFRRVDLELTGHWTVIQGPERILRTLNVSERGLLFVSEREFQADSVLAVRLAIPDSGEPLSLLVRTISCERHHFDEFETSARIIEMSRADQARLQYYLRDIAE